MNAKSRHKYDPPARTDTAASMKGRRANGEMEALERTYNKAYTQVETLDPPGKKACGPILIPRFKPVKRETINYAKFSCIYTGGELESGVIELEETLGCGANASVRLGR